MVGYRISQIRMGYLIGLTALLLAGTGWCGTRELRCLLP
jgi:hypothetical protein